MSVTAHTNQPDTVGVHFLCGETGLPFRVIFSRMQERYRISTIERVSPLPQVHDGKQALTLDFDFELCDTSDFSCPWCSNANAARSNLWRCGCGGFSCGAAAQMNSEGRMLFECQHCGKHQDLTNHKSGGIGRTSVTKDPVSGSVANGTGHLLTYQGS